MIVISDEKYNKQLKQEQKLILLFSCFIKKVLVKYF